MSSCPPIRRNRAGPPSSIRPAKIAPSAGASRKAWKTSALARSNFPAPTARAIAAEGAGAGFAGAGIGVEIVAVWVLMGAPSLAGLEQRLRQTVLKNRAAALRARLCFVDRSWPYICLVEAVCNASFLGHA